jgi:hypothetical protein
VRAKNLLLTLPAAALAACASATVGSSPATTDVLHSGNAMREVKTAQAWLRSAGRYHFHETFAQHSTAHNLSGVPAQLAQAFDGQISFTADGDQTGDKQIGVVATVAGVSSPIHLVESACTGYDSTDGATWYKGDDPRWLTRMMAPTMDDGLAAAAWHDLGATTHDNVAVHHLQATLTALAMSGAAPSPGATPPPGYTVEPTTADLWLRSDNAAPLAFDVEIRSTADLHALAANTQYAGATGTVTSTLSAHATFSSAQTTVAAPQAAGAGKDPVPQQIYAGFGGFGVEKDSCSTTTG